MRVMKARLSPSASRAVRNSSATCCSGSPRVLRTIGLLDRAGRDGGAAGLSFLSAAAAAG
jgi:hypothetical protein